MDTPITGRMIVKGIGIAVKTLLMLLTITVIFWGIYSDGYSHAKDKYEDPDYPIHCHVNSMSFKTGEPESYRCLNGTLTTIDKNYLDNEPETFAPLTHKFLSN